MNWQRKIILFSLTTVLPALVTYLLKKQWEKEDFVNWKM